MKLIDFMNTTENWQEVIQDAPYYCSVNQDKEYYIVKYNQIKSDFNNELVRECRGVIVTKELNGDWRVVCHAMDKFGNYGESYCPELNWRAVSVQEKIDGSLIKVWYDYGWHISTNGTIDAFKAPTGSSKYPTFGALVLEALECYFDDYHEDFFGKLDRGCTYWFELVSPYTRVVIPYKDIELYFLGWRDLFDDKELDPMDCVLHNYLPIPQRYLLTTLARVQEVAERLPWDSEGYVCCDDKFNRIKVKSPAYVYAHYNRNNNTITDERLIDVVLRGEHEEFLLYCEDFAADLDAIEQSMTDTQFVAQDMLDKVISECSYRDYENTKKGFVQAAQSVALPKYLPFLFKWYDNWKRGDAYTWDDFTKSWTAAKWEKFLKA